MAQVPLKASLRAVSTLLVVSLAALVGLTLGVLLVEPLLAPVALVGVVATGVACVRSANEGGLQIQQIDRLRQAELALASAPSPAAAAQELAEHAIALLGAPHATVLIEGIGDTVRVSQGDASSSVYGSGSRMRLLDDDGVPCGSIAVSARADGRPYTAQQERMLDALAQRVSSTLHRLSLFTYVQAERRTLADVLESSSDGIFTVGQDMSVRSWNPAMAQILGVSAGDALGHPVGAVFRPVDELGQARFGQLDPGRTGRPMVALVSVDGADGESRWLTCSWSPLSEGGYVVVARDDTSRKKVQDDKDGWIAQVSHELRTPLTPIKGFLHTLQAREADFSAADRRRMYDVMVREEQRLEDLVTSLLQVTTIDQHGLVVVAETIDWPDLVEAQVDVFRRDQPDRTFEVHVEEADDCLLVADPSLAVGVLTNLLSNAVKYAPQGRLVEIRIERDGGHVVTTVSDDGPGVPRSDRVRIFDKFTRLGDHLTRPQQGVGLGLYIAQHSLDQMDGDIWCDERPGGGAAFGFALPAAPSPEPVGTGGRERQGRRRTALRATTR